MNLTKHFEFATSDENPRDFLLCWYGHTVGYFKMGGVKQWAPLAPAFKDLFVMDEEGKLPMFLDNLKPEGWLKDHVDAELQTDYIRDGKRFLSNLVIYHRNGGLDLDNDGSQSEIMLDERLTQLADFVDKDGIFTGKCSMPKGMSDDPVFEHAVAKYWENKHMPRFSGAELKFPTCLSVHGDTEPALDKPFNVIAKYPGRFGYEALGVNEFLGMKMAKAAGLDTPAFALVDQGDNLPPIYMIERYDIPFKGVHDEWLITQDFCTLMQKKGDDKDACSLEQIGKRIAEVSKLAGHDQTHKNLEDFFKRSAFAWIMNDGDLHMKNMSMLYAFDPAAKTIRDISFAPCYDPTTDVFSNRGGVDATLRMSGKKSNLKVKSFIDFAQNLGLYKDENGKTDPKKVEAVILDMAKTAADTAVDFARNMPGFIKDHAWSFDVKVQASHVVDRARALGVKGLDWDSDAVWKEFKTKGPLARRAEQEMEERMGSLKYGSEARKDPRGHFAK